MKIVGQALKVGYGVSATIDVTYPEGATVTCVCDGTVYTAPDTTGRHVFRVHKLGTWVLTATRGEETRSKSVVISIPGQAESVKIDFARIYGIERVVENSSVVWTRTDEGVGKTATASVGTVAGASDFDTCYPWSDMVRETLSTGDVMVRIPEFYYQRYVENGTEHIRIADKPTVDFAKHPGSGKYIGAYKTSSDNRSLSGASPTVSQKREEMRTNAKAKGEGWGIIDKAAESAVQMLCLVEFATNDVQTAIGGGFSYRNSVGVATGTCDSVPNLTGGPRGIYGKTDVVYRGIEGFWGNIWEWVDGINWNGGTYYVCTDPSRYADDTSSYTALGFTGATNWSNSYITAEGMDDNVPWAMLPSAAGSGSTSTYQTDACYSATGWRAYCRGGYWAGNMACGLFACSLRVATNSVSTNIGSRLLYTPS